MQLAAKKFHCVTQMCNQIQSHSAYRTAVNWVHKGLIGKVKEVHSWQGGSPSWPRHIPRPAGTDPVPSHVRWDLWQGVAPEQPYKVGMYHPFNCAVGRRMALVNLATWLSHFGSRFQIIETDITYVARRRSTEADA